MAAGWPTKVTYANGDVYSASDVNDTNGTLNYIDPTAATDNQVLTRDAAAGGKVKWANSPANTLTTTGDLYYASAANTPARLPIGTTNQVLSVSGGVPTWSTTGGAMTVIASGSLSSTTLTLSSISNAYNDLVLVVRGLATSVANTNAVRLNGVTSANYVTQISTSASTANTNRVGVSNIDLVTISRTAATANQVFYMQIADYANTTSTKYVEGYINNGSLFEFSRFYGSLQSTGAAINQIQFYTQSAVTFTAGTYILYGVK